MKDRSQEIIVFARTHGFSREEFQDALEKIYAANADMMLDTEPSGLFEVKTTFGDGHAVIVQARRECLQQTDKVQI